MNMDLTQIARAYALAAAKHAGQTRSCSGEPYINHLAEVAHLLAYATDGIDSELVIAGVLHDIVEDTDATPALLQTLFGAQVSLVVSEVTDPAHVDEATRRRLQVDHAPKLSNRAKLLKIADKTSNLRERLAFPPNLPPEEIRAYIRWGFDVVAGCRGLNERLDAAFDATLEDCEARFGPIR